jgi:hypothetical protein
MQNGKKNADCLRVCLVCLCEQWKGDDDEDGGEDDNTRIMMLMMIIKAAIML